MLSLEVIIKSVSVVLENKGEALLVFSSCSFFSENVPLYVVCYFALCIDQVRIIIVKDVP